MIRPNELLDFMRSHPLVTAATISPDGAPQPAILGVAANDALELVFDPVDNSRKFRNLQCDGRVAVVSGAAGGYNSGSHDERTVQYEGRADIPSGEELKRVQEEIYFKQFLDGRPAKTTLKLDERNDSINNVGSQARVDFGGANQPKGSEERSRTC